HEHFQIGIVADKDPLDGGDDDLLLIEGRDQDRDHRERTVSGKGFAQPPCPLPKSKTRQNEQPCDPKYDGAQKTVVKELGDIADGEEYRAIGIKRHSKRKSRHHFIALEASKLRNRHKAI